MVVGRTATKWERGGHCAVGGKYWRRESVGDMKNGYIHDGALYRKARVAHKGGPAYGFTWWPPSC
jgi:hypothetical protein